VLVKEDQVLSRVISPWEVLAEVPDPLDVQGRRHPLPAVLALTAVVIFPGRAVCTPSAPIILSTQRNIALNLLNANAVKNKSAALRRHAAHPQEALDLIRSKDDF
jgi:hypothetical protein